MGPGTRTGSLEVFVFPIPSTNRRFTPRLERDRPWRAHPSSPDMLFRHLTRQSRNQNSIAKKALSSRPQGESLCVRSSTRTKRFLAQRKMTIRFFDRFVEDSPREGLKGKPTRYRARYRRPSRVDLTRNRICNSRPVIFCLFPAQLHNWIKFYKAAISSY
uniref:Uncharacterized protein n=1 Tax=Candidatus Kentrum sp. LFY TaxID=2126342 RepID=A0A450WR88_9GAMM|nr:MAG: hypothetical protein BECKLFY1418C_GA0070996_10596 [Candidatus Kentron sp. LFY]